WALSLSPPRECYPFPPFSLSHDLVVSAMVSYWLGHADINTTHIYVEIDMETKRKMIDRAGAPRISKKAPWQQPHILLWLNKLARGRELCAVNC
ncbi:MAG: hypothetical protein NTY64_09940, partial [Deltaproteobacteria bacterium]|nr:hypothetical protein [Deltaproteobacteria bacterium]